MPFRGSTTAYGKNTVTCMTNQHIDANFAKRMSSRQTKELPKFILNLMSQCCNDIKFACEQYKKRLYWPIPFEPRHALLNYQELHTMVYCIVTELRKRQFRVFTIGLGIPTELVIEWGEEESRFTGINHIMSEIRNVKDVQAKRPLEERTVFKSLQEFQQFDLHRQKNKPPLPTFADTAAPKKPSTGSSSSSSRTKSSVATKNTTQTPASSVPDDDYVPPLAKLTERFDNPPPLQDYVQSEPPTTAPIQYTHDYRDATRQPYRPGINNDSYAFSPFVQRPMPKQPTRGKSKGKGKGKGKGKRPSAIKIIDL